MPDASPFSPMEIENEFRQAEIISDVRQYFYNIEHDRIDIEIKPYCVIASQDCDLLQDFKRRQEGKQSNINGILLFEAQTVATMRAGGMERKVFERIAQNGNDRYHFIQSTSIECDLRKEGIPELIIDFKRYFTVAAVDLHWQVLLEDGPKRRCRMVSPYMEHFQLRAAYYMSRIALPYPHAPAANSFQAALPPPVAAALARAE